MGHGEGSFLSIEGIRQRLVTGSQIRKLTGRNWPIAGKSDSSANVCDARRIRRINPSGRWFPPPLRAFKPRTESAENQKLSRYAIDKEV